MDEIFGVLAGDEEEGHGVSQLLKMASHFFSTSVAIPGLINVVFCESSLAK